MDFHSEQKLFGHLKHSSISDEEEEGHGYLSLSDMFVSIIFIFMILLMVFALRYQDETSRLKSNNDTRKQILEKIRADMKSAGINGIIDWDAGSIRFPLQSGGDDKNWFESGSHFLTGFGSDAVEELAKTLQQTIPCYINDTPEDYCDGLLPGKRLLRGKIEAVIIEGHADDQPLQHNTLCKNNWVLSAQRAIETYVMIMGGKKYCYDNDRLVHDDRGVPQSEVVQGFAAKYIGNLDKKYELGNLVNSQGAPLFGISAYSDLRPVEPVHEDEFWKWYTNHSEVSDIVRKKRDQNRRIEIRIIMESPDSHTDSGKIRNETES